MNFYYSTALMKERLESAADGEDIRNIASRARMQRVTAKSYIYGDALPNSERLAGLCNALNRSADYFLFGKEEPRPNKYIRVFDELPEEYGYYITKDQNGLEGFTAYTPNGWSTKHGEVITKWSYRPED